MGAFRIRSKYELHTFQKSKLDADGPGGLVHS